MPRYKLFSLFERLDAAEYAAVIAFIRFQTSHKEHTAIVLFKALEKHYPKWSTTDDSMLLIHRVVFKKLEYRAQRVRDAMSNLTVLLEKYIAFSAWQKDHSGQVQASVNGHLSRQSFERAYAAFRQYEEETYHTDFLSTRLALREKLYFFPGTDATFRKESLQTIIQEQEVVWVLKTLRWRAESLLSKRLLNTQVVSFFLESALAWVEKNEHPVASCYSLVLKALEHSSPELSSFDLLPAYEAALPDASALDRAILFKCIQLLMIPLLHAPDVANKKLLSSFYKTSVAYTCYLSPFDQYASFVTFQNIVACNLAANELDWTKKFIEENIHHLSKADQKQTLPLLWARWCYYKALQATSHAAYFEQAQAHLSSIQNPSLEVELLQKSMQLQLYYDAFFCKDYEIDSMERQIRNFRRFVRLHSSLSEEKKKGYLDAARLLSKLCRHHIIPSPSMEKTKRLQQEIQNRPYREMQGWLLGRV